jgi:hypothetical protein
LRQQAVEGVHAQPCQGPEDRGVLPQLLAAESHGNLGPKDTAGAPLSFAPHPESRRRSIREVQTEKQRPPDFRSGALGYGLLAHDYVRRGAAGRQVRRPGGGRRRPRRRAVPGLHGAEAGAGAAAGPRAGAGLPGLPRGGGAPDGGAGLGAAAAPPALRPGPQPHRVDVVVAQDAPYGLSLGGGRLFRRASPGTFLPFGMLRTVSTSFSREGHSSATISPR